METAITEAPRYRLILPFYVDDQYIAEGVEIEFGGVPNEGMEPLNEPARTRMTDYLGTLEGGRTPRVEDVYYIAMKNRPKEGDAVVLPHAVKDVPQMGGLSKLEPKAKILATPTAPIRPKKLMGTVVVETPPTGDSSL